MDTIIKEHFDRHRSEGRTPPELADAEIEAVPHPDEGLLEDARDWRSRPWFDDPKSDAVLKGAVDDLLQMPDGEIVVLDYKTRGYYERQVNLYNLILAENGYETADFGLLLYYYPDTVNEEGDVVFHREFAKVPTDLEAARELVQEAVRVLDGPEPGPDSECEFCRWEREEHVEEI
jgi:RecB family exonuclease